jgi:protein-disulfide isomerase
MTTFRACAALVLFVLALVAPLAAAAQSLTPEQQQQVERIVREYLLKNPELLVEMSNALRAQQEKAKSGRAQAGIVANQTQLLNDPNSFAAGNPAGDVTIVEFFDYQCGYCKRVHPTLTTLVQRDKGVRIVLKELPILGPGSETASRAAIASLLLQRDKYYPFHTALMQNPGALDEAAVLAIAGRVGLDVDKLRAEMPTPRVTSVITQNRLLAQVLGVDGTPMFVIGNRLISGALTIERLQEMVEQQRKK